MTGTKQPPSLRMEAGIRRIYSDGDQSPWEWWLDTSWDAFSMKAGGVTNSREEAHHALYTALHAASAIEAQHQRDEAHQRAVAQQKESVSHDDHDEDNV